MANRQYDILVIGAGHAGAEAAWAAANAGARVALLTIRRDKVAEMSCNPAVGGLAKGQIAREVDALGGLMGLATDAAGIQFRMLNRSKGPAVWAPRAQTDKRKYARYVRQLLQSHPNIDLVQATVARILTDDHKTKGVECTDGQVLHAAAVIVTTGTFLNGLIHVGPQTFPAGRINEPPAVDLSDSLRRLGLRLGRLKTGTCPRLLKDSIDFDRLNVQRGDDPPQPFSFMTDAITTPQVPCHITYTNAATHRIIRDNLRHAPLFTGQIQSTGPRYCPSIELKIVRFADKDQHQIFLEPESLEYDWIYCNGMATSLPRQVQQQMVRSVPGLEMARIVQYGYAIEYDFVPPTQLYPSLQCKTVKGLFFAGQINGTSGYEEAAGQGIIAGINAVRQLCGKDPIVLRRDQAYIGVLIDDLVTKGADEPYRMFTSRAEYRLLLRSDNADQRLTPLGRQVGTVNDARWQRFQQWQQQDRQLRQLLETWRLDGMSASRFLRRPDASWDQLIEKLNLRNHPQLQQFEPRVIHRVATDIKYSGYLARQGRMIERFRQLEDRKIPSDIDFSRITGLRREAAEKLAHIQPATLGQAGRISGINPADILVLMIHLKRSR